MDSRPTQHPEALLADADFVKRMARDLLFDPHQAEDVAQSTWVAALESPPPGKVTRGWLRTVTRNLVRQGRRGDDRRNRREKAAAKAEALPSVGDVLEREAIRREVFDAVIALDEPYRTAVLLRYYEELAPREIAERLKLPVETVRTRLKRALAKLRTHLDEGHEGDRSAWSALLLPFAGKEPWMTTSTTVTSGTLLSTTAGKLAAAAVVALGGGAAWWFAQSGGEVPPDADAAVRAAESESDGAVRNVEGDADAPTPATSLADTDPRVPASPQAGTAHAIRGHVVTHDDVPVEGAVVLFTAKHPEELEGQREWNWMEEGPHDARAVTDARGEFVLPLRDESKLWARVHPVSPSWFLQIEGRWVESGEDYRFSGEDIPIARLRVRAEEVGSGTPLENFGVSFDRTDGDYSREVDAEGPVAERVLALPRDTRSGEFRVTVLDPRVIAASALVRVDQGATKDVVVPFEWGREIQGVVVDPHGTPLEGALVFFGEREVLRGGRPTGNYDADHAPHATQTDAGGNYTLRGSGGLLTAWHAQHTPTTVTSADAGRIQLQESATIRGRIELPADWLAELEEAGRLDDRRAEGFWVTLDRAHKVRMEADGSFEFSDVEAGSHGLSFPPERWVTVQVAAGETLDVEVPPWIDEVKLDFVSGGAAFDGADGEGVNGIVVGFGDVASLHEFGKRDDGTYRVRRMLPGRYAFIQRHGILGLADIDGDRGTVDVGDKSLRVYAGVGRRVWLQPAGANETVAYWSRRQLTEAVPDGGVLTFDPLPQGTYELGFEGGPALTTVTVVKAGTETSLE